MVLGDLLIATWNNAGGRDGGLLPASSRSALIQLIYKGAGDPEDISNYRPIALLACEYKRMARCLARRLLPFLVKIIHTDPTFGKAKRSIFSIGATSLWRQTLLLEDGRRGALACSTSTFLWLHVNALALVKNAAAGSPYSTDRPPQKI